MTVFVLCLVCVVGLTSGRFFDIVRHELQKDASNGKRVCLVEDILTNCIPAISLGTHAYPGTICRHADRDLYTLCQRDGSWLIDVRYKALNDYNAVTKRMYHTKKKRFWGVVAVVACYFFCPRGDGGDGGGRKPNSFPEITCPTIPPQKATTGTSMVVTWEEPEGRDNEDGTITNVQRTGLPPGSEFDEGTHIITYRVTDNEGFPASCQVIFSVKATYCSTLPWPRDGTRHCTNRDIAGSTCTFDCDRGYEIQGSNSVTCSAGGWSGAIPKCQAKSCGPAPTVSNGALTCLGDTVYGTYCLLTCKRGYEYQGLIVSMCSESGQWTPPGTCIDFSAPVFTFGCPEDVTEYADKKEQPRAVTWSDPEVKDASAVTIKYNPVKGSPFSVGQTKVTAVATDADGNTARCSFKVNINSLNCAEPDLGDDKLRYNCSDGYGYGFSCSVSCHSGYPLKGSNSILCEKDDSVFPPTTSWTWPEDSIKPFCRTVTCPDLRFPSNGALSCDAWSDGPMCVMMCNEAYDVPRNVPDTYACGEQSGRWFPSDTVYDCTVMRRAGQMKLASEFYYYSGSCQDEATRRAIAESFIHIVNTSTTFTTVCGATVPECRPELVDVYCGAVTRKKRESQHLLFKKETVAIIIYFNILTVFEVKPDEEFTTVRTGKENLLYSAVDAVDQMLSDGELNMEDKGVTAQADSHRPGSTDFDCVDGVANYDKGSCRGCPTGTYTVPDGCVDCPVGTYNDGDFANSCMTCGEGMSTKTNGSKSAENCTALCPSGSYSRDGMAPCTPCDPGTYQDAVGATSCTACPAATTSTQGADDSGRCVAFDLKITAETVWGEVTSDMTSFTLVYWFRAYSNAGSILSAVKDSLGNTIVSLSVTNTLQAIVDGNTVDTGASPATDRWQHVTLTIDGSTKKVTVYLNGNEAYTRTVTSLSTPVVPQGSTSTSVPTSGDIHLSGIAVIGRVLSPEEVQSSAGSCLTSLQNSGFKFLKSGQKLLVPSLCDAADDCSASPCGSHPCTDEIGDFSCDCQDGWTGTTCDTPPDYCAHHECKHGAVCENGKTNYTCKCLKGFKGDLCQVVIVNGQWSAWTIRTECSVTCNGGNQTRRRECDSPPPDDDGDDCVGAAEEIVTCNSKPCPVCPPLSLSLGNEKNCTEEDGLKRCKVTCRLGMVFADSDIVPPVYECGLTTGYNWSHQIDNKRARPPSCKKAVGASKYAATHTARFSKLSCDLASQKAPEVRSQVSTVVNDLHCVKDGICSASSSLSPCDQSTTGKRSVSPATVVINIVAEMNNSISTDLEVLAFNGTITSNLEDYVNKVLNTDLTVQTLVNNSDTLLQLTLEGAVYSMDPNTMTTVAVISCPDGTVPADGVCGECPVGTREQDSICVPCEKGTFQDQAASATCQPCPQGKTTLGTGSTEITDCNIDAGGHDGNKQESTLPIVLAPTIVGGLMLIAIALFLVWKMKFSSRPSSSGSTRKIQVHPVSDPPPPYYPPPKASLPNTPPPNAPPPCTEKPGSQSRPVSVQGVVLSQAWQNKYPEKQNPLE